MLANCTGNGSSNFKVPQNLEVRLLAITFQSLLEDLSAVLLEAASLLVTVADEECLLSVMYQPLPLKTMPAG